MVVELIRIDDADCGARNNVKRVFIETVMVKVDVERLC